MRSLREVDRAVVGSSPSKPLLMVQVKRSGSPRIYPRTCVQSCVMTKLKVLIVEDDHLVRSFATELLEDAGFEVVEARNAKEALLMLQHEDGVHVLFTDVDMPPGDNGVVLARKVHERWPDIGLVVTSGYSFFADSELPDSGRFVAKPAQPDMLVKVIKQAARV